VTLEKTTTSTTRSNGRAERKRLSRRVRGVIAVLRGPVAEREGASDHVRSAAQVLTSLAQFGNLNREDRRDVNAALRRLWLALEEIERERCA